MSVLESFKKGIKNKANLETGTINKISYDIGEAFGKTINKLDQGNEKSTVPAESAFRNGFFGRWNASDYHGLSKITYSFGKITKKLMVSDKDKKIVKNIDWSENCSSFKSFVPMCMSGLFNVKNMLRAVIQQENSDDENIVKTMIGMTCSLFLILAVCMLIPMIGAMVGSLFPVLLSIYVYDFFSVLGFIPICVFTYMFLKSLVLTAMYKDKVKR